MAKTNAQLQAEVDKLKAELAEKGSTTPDGMLMIAEILKNMQEQQATAPLEEVNDEKTKYDRDRYINQMEAFLQKCKDDETREVFGSSILVESMGEYYTWTYNGVPVTIRFNDTYQEYPKFVAEFLEKKLASIYKSNARKVENLVIGA